MATSLLLVLIALLANLNVDGTPDAPPATNAARCSLIVARGLGNLGTAPRPIRTTGAIDVARGEHESFFVLNRYSTIAASSPSEFRVDAGGFGVDTFRVLPVPQEGKRRIYDVMAPSGAHDTLAADARPVYVVDIEIPVDASAGRQNVQFALGGCEATLELKVSSVRLPAVSDLIVQGTVDPPTPAWPAEIRALDVTDDTEGLALETAATTLDYGITAFAGVFPRLTVASLKSPRGQATLAELEDFLSNPAVRHFRLPVSQFHRNSTYADRFGDSAPAKSYSDLLTEELIPYSALLENPNYRPKLSVKLWDEPVPANYGEVASLYEQARAALPGIPLELAEQPEAAIAGIADIWTVHVDYLLEDDVIREHAAGKRVYLYANALQAIQKDSDAMRRVGWLLWRFDLDGYHFWRLNWWNQDPWTTASSWKNDFDKTGTFVYPAQNGQVYPSVRLLAFREGLEDLALLRRLDECASEDASRDWLAMLKNNILATADAPVNVDLYAARARLLRYLEACETEETQ